MLVVQPSSTCDVCLERYAWDAPATEHISKPHVISCGHVFCHQCLQNLRIPRTCPLCRAAFHLTRAVRVHVDLAIEDTTHNPTEEELEARGFEQRLAELFIADSNQEGSSSSTVDSDESRTLIEEATLWLETVPLDAALSESLETTQAEITRIRGERDHVRRQMRRVLEQEKLLSQNQEKIWTTRISEIERDCEKKLTEADMERQQLEEELLHLRRTLEDAHKAQKDVLVQAQLQIHSQSRELDVSRAKSPYVQPNSIPTQPSQQSIAVQPSHTDSHPQAGPSTSAIAFPRAISPIPTPYDSAYEFNFNPLPAPPQPVPMSRLPEFARPRPGTSAYNEAKALARYAHGRVKEGRREREGGRDKEKARSDRKREKEQREKDRERDRERQKIKDWNREREGTGTDSGTGKERRRTRAGKEKDRGTDTSATETQERRRTRTRHSSLAGPLASKLTQPGPSHPIGTGHANGNMTDYDGANGRIHGKPNALPALPRDIVGGWGLERSWRASLASNTSGTSASASMSRENLLDQNPDVNGALGSSHTTMRVDEVKGEGKGKGKGKEREKDVDVAGDEMREDFVFVHPAEQQQGMERRSDRDQERPNSQAFPSGYLSSHESMQGYPQPQAPSQQIYAQGRERERRTTLSSEPSALGLKLVPSPDGRGYVWEDQYQYQYQYQPVAPQSTIRTGSTHGSVTGKESVTPLANLNGTRNHYSFAPEMQSRTSTASNATMTLTRRATDSHLQAQAQAQALYGLPRLPRVPSTTPALHVPQPRRVSLTIPEPEAEVDTSPQPVQPIQPQPRTAQSFRTEGTYDYPSGSTSAYYTQSRTTGGTLYSNTNPNANMSLDSALASLSLAGNGSGSGGAGPGDDTALPTLRHRTSNSSTASASTGISLTGTSGERRKQLLDALLTGAEQKGEEQNRLSLGKVLDASAEGATTSTSGPAPVVVAETLVRGVPSRDGRPSRGLSTRPSTTHPHIHPSSTQPSAVNPYGQPQRPPADSRHQSYTNPGYTSNYGSAGSQGGYAGSAGSAGHYAPQQQTQTQAQADAYAAYAYYQAQAQTHAPTQAQGMSMMPRA